MKNNDLTFVEAVEAMMKGKLCRPIQQPVSFSWKYELGEFYVINDFGTVRSSFCLGHYLEKWEIVE